MRNMTCWNGQLSLSVHFWKKIQFCIFRFMWLLQSMEEIYGLALPDICFIQFYPLWLVWCDVCLPVQLCWNRPQNQPKGCHQVFEHNRHSEYIGWADHRLAGWPAWCQFEFALFSLYDCLRRGNSYGTFFEQLLCPVRYGRPLWSLHFRLVLNIVMIYFFGQIFVKETHIFWVCLIWRKTMWTWSTFFVYWTKLDQTHFPSQFFI